MKITPKFINFNKVAGKTSGVTKDLTEYLYTYIAPELSAKLEGVIDEVSITVSKRNAEIKVQMLTLYMGKEIKIEEQGKNFYLVMSLCTKAFIHKVLKVKAKYYSNKKNSRRTNKVVSRDIVLNEHLTIEEPILDKEEFIVKKTKTFDIKPMSIEEAIMQMNLLKHKFFIFRNAETELVNLVYKRKDETYGLIEESCI